MTELYRNNNYIVRVQDIRCTYNGNDYVRSYGVFNIKTGVEEFRTPAYPEACFIAEDLNAAIDGEAWKWRNQVAEAEQEIKKIGAAAAALGMDKSKPN